jgi:Delta7-sterol 5-desaturase
MLYHSIDAAYGWPGLLGFSLVFGLGLYAAVATLAYAYYFRLGRARFMPDYRPDRAELLHAIRWSIYGIVGNALLLLPIQLLVVHGYSRLYADVGAYGWAYLPLSLVMVVVFAETCIYWIHRALHRQLLYRWLHRYHHRYREPTPAISFSFHPLDSFAQSTPYHIFAFLLPLHDAIYAGLIGFAALWALLIHNRVCWVPPTLVNNTGCHTAHHWYYRYNYGNYFTVWDRLAGTYFDPAGLPERFFASKYGWRRAAAPPVLTGAENIPPAPAP